MECTDWKTLIEAWEEALEWTEGLDRALSVMLASVASVRMIGDQLWVKIIGPPSSAKSTLCEALAVNTKYVFAKSSIRGFFSGYKTKDGKDASLVPLVMDKTLVTKDGDTLLRSPNLPQILAEGRDLYDGTSRTHYRNLVGHDYSGIRMTWILCGTNSLREIDSSELGERFLDCVLADTSDADLERRIGLRVAIRASQMIGMMSNGKPETRNDPRLVRAMQLTGGYVSWLRENAHRGLARVGKPQWALEECVRLGEFTAMMRAKPSLTKRAVFLEDKPEREYSPRLISQFVRLAACLAFVLNKPSIDREVMDRVRKVALDTSRGRTLMIVTHLARKSMDSNTLGQVLGTGLEKARNALMFLRDIGVVECYEQEKGNPLWRLVPRVRSLFKEIAG